MGISDWINVVLCILSFALAVISVVTVVVTLRQNHKMIENAVRPYVVVSYETICMSSGSNNRFIVIRNYGQSAAEIKTITCIGIQDEIFLEQISHLEGSSLAPQQKRIYFLRPTNTAISKTPALFTCTYTANGRTYSESITTRMDSGSLIARTDSESYALQEIAERLL